MKLRTNMKYLLLLGTCAVSTLAIQGIVPKRRSPISIQQNLLNRPSSMAEAQPSTALLNSQKMKTIIVCLIIFSVHHLSTEQTLSIYFCYSRLKETLVAGIYGYDYFIKMEICCPVLCFRKTTLLEKLKSKHSDLCDVSNNRVRIRRHSISRKYSFIKGCSRTTWRVDQH